MPEPQYFAVFGTDAAGTAALRQELRPLHRELLHGGPTLDAQGAMNGTLLIIEGGSEESVRAFVAADPYVRNGLFGDLQVRRWTWSLGR